MLAEDLFRFCFDRAFMLSLSKAPPVNYVYRKMLLNENESYLVLVAKQVLLETINNVY